MVIHSHNHLPEELLLYEIFRRLPVETLLACNCVCKRWNSVISSPFFASFHLKQSPFSSHQFLLMNTKTCFLSYNFEDHESYKVAETPVRYASSIIVASCNGLICLDDKANKSLYIWNPTTSNKVQIPYPKPLIKTEVVWGFGYVSTTEDYKLIKIIDHKNLKKLVQVFSFNSNAWNSLDVSEKFGFGELPPLFGTGLSVNNMIYWAVYYTEYDVGFYDKCFHILGFNLITEKLMPVEPLPEWPDHGFDDPPALFQKDGCLCVCWKNEGGTDIGMLKEEEAGKSSWKKLFHFDQDAFRFDRRIWSQKFQGITVAGNYVVYLDGESISLLDPNQDPPKEVSSLKIPMSTNVISYVKSLLSPLDLVRYKN